jgi:hypothetical protein
MKCDIFFFLSVSIFDGNNENERCIFCVVGVCKRDCFRCGASEVLF